MVIKKMLVLVLFELITVRINVGKFFAQKLLQFTVSIRKSHRQTEFTSSLVCEDLLLVQLIFAFLYASRIIENDSVQFVRVYPLFFCCKFRFFTQPHKQKSNGVMSGDSNSSISLTAQNQAHVNMNFLTMADIITSHNIDISSEISFTFEIL